MWDSAPFKKATGVTPEASTEALEAALLKKAHATIAAEVAVSLLCHRLSCLQWTVSEAASLVGLSSSSVSRKGNAGAILWACGPEMAEVVHLWVKPLTTDDLTKLSSSLDAIQATHDQTAEERRTMAVVRFGVLRTVAARLGDNCTEDRAQAITDAILAAGHVTPVAVAKAIPGTATGMEIPLPAAGKRNTSGAKAEAPTMANAAKMAEQALADRVAGSDADNPVTFTQAEVDAAWHAIGTAIRVIKASGAAPYDVAAQFGEMVDAVWTLGTVNA